MDVAVRNQNAMSRYEQIRALIDSLGCHLSWHELNAVSRDKASLRREEEILAREKWDFSDRPTYYTAVRNLQGFIAYKLDKFEEAQRFFEDVLGKDENNINALANLAHIAKGIGKFGKNRQFEDRLIEILTKPSYQERARSYADRSHAIRHFEQFKRCLKYKRYIQLAATIGKKCVEPQRAEWLFDYALVLYRQDVQMLYVRMLHAEKNEPLDNSDCYSNPKIKQGFLSACKHFLEVALISSSSRDYQALSWVFLGILVNHDPEHRSLAEVFPEKPDYHLTPEQCFEKGLGIHPEHEIVLRRVGSEYVKLKRLTEAKELLDKSLNIMPSRFGFRYRADMYLKMYEESVGNEEAVGQLKDAALDLQEALQMKEVHADFSDLGYIYFLLGDTKNALFMFLRATNNEQVIDYDFFDPVLAHRRWAICLEKDNQLEGSKAKLQKAEEIRKQILDTPLQEEELDVNFEHDFERYNTSEKPGFVRVLSDYHLIWRACSERRLSDLGSCLPRGTGGRYTYDVFVCHTEKNARWAVAFVNKLEVEHNIKCCIGGRDFQCGKEVQKIILDSLKLSHRCVVTLPGSQGWMSFTISQALLVSNTREDGFILPIKLEDCTVPEELQHLTVRECEEGQIKQEHWDEIVALCRQTQNY